MKLLCFPAQMKDKLAKYLDGDAKMYYGLFPGEVRKHAYNYAMKN